MGRKELPLNPFRIDISNLESFGFSMPKEYPQINNPLYTCIFTLGVRENKGGAILTSKEIDAKLNDKVLAKDGKCPDLVVLNNDIVAFPIINGVFESPFCMESIPDWHFQIFNKEGMAWGIAISLMFLAFERIHLGNIDWKGIIAKTLCMQDNRNKKEEPR